MFKSVKLLLVLSAAVCLAEAGICRAEDLSRKIDSLRLQYDFPHAVEMCLDALEDAADSLSANDSTAILSRLVLCENGLNMMRYCVEPTVVARERFSTAEFFLFYPMEAGSWTLTPSPLDTLGGDVYSKAIYAPRGGGSIIFSVPDTLGVRNICETHFMDSTWSEPALLSETLASSENEIYPIISPDGNTLWFASKGHYGMGGYDLYFSEKDDDGQWSAPQNMGFPYSSPYNDFLLYNTPDGKYTIFASDRACPGSDSLYLYVLQYEPLPIRRQIDDVKALRDLSSLNIRENPAMLDNSSVLKDDVMDSDEASRYMKKMDEVREKRVALAALGKELDALRLRYEDERSPKLRAEIEQKEMAYPEAKASLEKASKELQEIEMDFLISGVVLDMDKVKADAGKEVVGVSSGYTFTKMKL